MAIDVVPVVDEGLGNSGYLVDVGDGRGLAVDLSIDLRQAFEVARRRRLSIAFAAETHLHADFVSGTRQLGATGGARVLASAAGRREFAHVGVSDGQEVDLGGLRLRVLSTPGHTYEHVAYLLLDGDRPVGVFTGGSLLVGAAARTDLVSPASTEDLTRRQYESLQRLRQLPDEVAVWPTHGAGSFCSAPPGVERTSTIGREKASNPLLRTGGADAFARELLGSLGSFPPYFLRLAEVNRRGLVLDAEPALLSLSVDSVRGRLADGALLIDVRPIVEFATGHVPGSLSIPLRPAFASWLGWLVPHDQPVVVVRGSDQDPADIAWHATKIGHSNLAGELAGGIDAWTTAGHATTRIRLVEPDRVARSDISRQPTCWISGRHRSTPPATFLAPSTSNSAISATAAPTSHANQFW